MMKVKTTLTLLTVALTSVGCGSDSNYDFDQSVENAQQLYSAANPTAIYDPANGDIPTTNDLLFSGSTDGTLNIPIDTTESASAQALKASLNTLDGFSTVAPITARFNADIDATSAVLGDTVRVFEMNGGVPTEITSAADMLVTISGGNTLVLLPTSPLQAATTHIVLVNNGLKNTSGVAFAPSSSYALAKATTAYTEAPLDALEPVRQAVNSYEALAGSDADKANVILSWSFKTQSIGPVLADLYDDNTSGTFLVSPTGATTKTFLDPTDSNPAITGSADVYLGQLTVPYFSAIGGAAQDTGPLTRSWTGVGGSFLTAFNTSPVSTGDVNIPVLITVPNGSSEPTGGWPVVIFQHGITQNRTNLLALAESLAAAGFMGVAIDMPLHGITDATNPLNAANTAFPDDVEPTFSLDVVNNETNASGPDGITDDSGTHFINLTSLLTSRDNIRQGASNLFVLTNSLNSLTPASAAPVPNVDTSNIRFVGHSLGGMTGTVYLAHETQVSSATLAMPGGGISQLLNNSATFGPRIKAGLAANGIEEGTADFETFLIAAQWILDSADPINLGAQAAASHDIHMIEVIGGNSGEPDQVIPNNVATAPLSGTEPLARVMGLSDITGTTTSGNIDGIVRFVAGDHSSILDPSASVEATVEMQTEIVSFAASNGDALPITDTSVIQQ